MFKFLRGRVEKYLFKGKRRRKKNFYRQGESYLFIGGQRMQSEGVSGVWQEWRAGGGGETHWCTTTGKNFCQVENIGSLEAGGEQ